MIRLDIDVTPALLPLRPPWSSFLYSPLAFRLLYLLKTLFFLFLEKFEGHIFITVHLNFCLVNPEIFRKYTHGRPALAPGGTEEY